METVGFQYFIRTHQSFLVNLRYVQEFIKKDGSGLKRKKGVLIPVSALKRAEVLEVIEGR